MNNKIYFDNAATSGIKPDAVIEAVCDCLRNSNANPGRSGHSLSVKASEIIYTARETIGEFFRFPRTENIALTKNATEALNIVLYGLLKTGGEVITTSMEHNSVMRPLNDLVAKGVINVKKLMADANGVVSPQQVNEAISKQTKLIVITSASNVTGTTMDLGGMHAVAEISGVKLLIDGAQGAGAMKIDWGNTPFDFLAITGHKHLSDPRGPGRSL
jgi:cysteine desulfurase/selenocysteine lyase